MEEEGEHINSEVNGVSRSELKSPSGHHADESNGRPTQPPPSATLEARVEDEATITRSSSLDQFSTSTNTSNGRVNITEEEEEPLASSIKDHNSERETGREAENSPVQHESIDVSHNEQHESINEPHSDHPQAHIDGGSDTSGSDAKQSSLHQSITSSQSSPPENPPITSKESDGSNQMELNDNSMPVTTPVLRKVEDVENCEERSGSRTSIVNESALSGTDSPTYEEDRNLEQFSEILLDSDSESEVQVAVGGGDSEGTIEKPKKNTKKVRFADQIDGEASSLPSSGSLPPSSHSSPLSPRQPNVHPNSSPTAISPRQKQRVLDEFINGVEIAAEYLGSTPILLDGIGAMRSARMFQAQQAVQLIKDPESESRPRFPVKIKVSTEAVIIADNSTNVELMKHLLASITYVADIDHVLVIMARPSSDQPSPHLGQVAAAAVDHDEPNSNSSPTLSKMTCHVLDTPNAREAAMAIGQAFSAAYKQCLREHGVPDSQLENVEYTQILHAQSVPRLEVESLGDKENIKKLTMAKHKNDILGIMVRESGYGSAIPSCVIVHMNKTGSASKSGLLNVGDHILSINGVNLVGMPRKTCIEQIKKCRYMTVIKMEVCTCPAVVDVVIVRPDLKYQLGFTIHEGMICSLVRGSIAERSGVRVGHRIIDINGTSTVGMQHSNIVHLLSSTVGDLHIRIMPIILYKLMTGQIQPEYY